MSFFIYLFRWIDTHVRRGSLIAGSLGIRNGKVHFPNEDADALRIATMVLAVKPHCYFIGAGLRFQLHTPYT